jgi:peptidoglycan/xylan/chitin deacetylase (PgdA/CDA1 family)
LVVLVGMVISLTVQATAPTTTTALSARPQAPSSAPSTTAPTAPVTPAPPRAPARVDCAKVKCVALTFDDGPVKNTSHVLEALSARGARATFFVMGIMARKRPDLLRRMIANGDAVGNHSWNHPIMFGLKAAAVRSQFVRTQKVINAAIGERPMLVRTPFGQQNAKIRKILAKLGSPVILWDVDPQDWKVRNAKVVIRRVVKATKRNSIVLLHDVWPSTRAAVPTIIEKLQAKGYVLVTVPELLGGAPTPGKVYLHR